MIKIGQPDTSGSVTQAELEQGTRNLITLRRIRINQGGYDDSGSYWGVGQPLYWYCSDKRVNGDYLDEYIRADDRAHAKEIILRKHGADLKFYR